jgi:hypothetical protein
MSFSRATIAFAFVTAALVPTAFAQSPSVASSPFADKVVDSYANGTDPVTKQPEIIHWGDLKPNDFGPRSITFSDAGMRPLHPVPAPGVHPRILFTTDDLPAMRDRMKNTVAGRIMYNHLLAYSHALRGTYDENAAYSKPDLWKGDYRGSHGNVQLWYYHDATSPFNPATRTFARLVAGDLTVDPKVLWPVFAIDALRCLIDNDEAGAKQLAKAVNTAMLHDQAARAAERSAKGVTKPISSPVSGGAGGQDFGYLYDFLYNWLTPEQRSAWHDELANTTWSHDNYGTFNSAVNNRSNWATFTYWLMPLLAIEGEPGYNELKAEGIYRGYYNFMTYGIFPDGAYVEGEAKDQLGSDGLIAMAIRHRPDLFGHPYLRTYVKDFLPHSILPNPEYRSVKSQFGYGPFLRFDLLGGLSNINWEDAVTLKYIFPQDKTIDWIYRSEVGKDYQYLPNRAITSYWNDVLIAAIFATDFDPANDDPGKLNLPLTYFSGARAVLMTRSDWSPNALFLAMHTRELNGGHPYADRNSIFLFGEGRAWTTLNQHSGDDTTQSEVTIDRHPQSVYSPGRVVDYVDKPLATFAVGDASYAWDWNLDVMNTGFAGYTEDEVKSGAVKIKPGWEPEMHSMNDFSYTKLPEAYMSAPLYHLHSWIGQDGRYAPMVRQANYPVLKAFRTAGLVRGEVPYSLILDDIQKDATVHHYDWQMLLEDDLAIMKTETLQQKNGVLDIYLAANGKAKKGDPVLLIRFLDCTPDPSKPEIKPTLLQPGDPLGDKKRKMLVVPVDAVSPNFKVLLLPYREGAPLPTIEWDGKHTTASIHFAQSTDIVRFSKAASGKTDIGITRMQNGQSTTLIEVNKPVPDLPAAAPASAMTQFP